MRRCGSSRSRSSGGAPSCPAPRIRIPSGATSSRAERASAGCRKVAGACHTRYCPLRTVRTMEPGATSGVTSADSNSTRPGSTSIRPASTRSSGGSCTPHARRFVRRARTARHRTPGSSSATFRSPPREWPSTPSGSGAACHGPTRVTGSCPACPPTSRRRPSVSATARSPWTRPARHRSTRSSWPVTGCTTGRQTSCSPER